MRHFDENQIILAELDVARIRGRVVRVGWEAAGMSEYQYYEFLALDRPLTAEQRAELRSISTRAEITATRFVNEYQWGDLKGDPRTMMERYFDAFLAASSSSLSVEQYCLAISESSTPRVHRRYAATSRAYSARRDRRGCRRCSPTRSHSPDPGRPASLRTRHRR